MFGGHNAGVHGTIFFVMADGVKEVLVIVGRKSRIWQGLMVGWLDVDSQSVKFKEEDPTYKYVVKILFLLQ